MKGKKIRLRETAMLDFRITIKKRKKDSILFAFSVMIYRNMTKIP
jgi:hypothetical protein